MMKFQVGEPLPLPLNPPRQEICQSSTNEAFFDIVYWIPNDANLSRSVKAWTKGKIKYGIFHAKDIPFFIVDFVGENWNFEVTTNIHKLQNDKVETWLNSDSNVINPYLCDCNTKILYGMRMIGIQPKVANELRDVLERQDEKYENWQAVEVITTRIMDTYTTADMMKNTKMHLL